MQCAHQPDVHIACPKNNWKTSLLSSQHQIESCVLMTHQPMCNCTNFLFHPSAHINFNIAQKIKK